MQTTALTYATGRELHSQGTMELDPRLKRAAREFEAQMMKELLAPINQRSALFEDCGSEESVMGEFASESLAGAISARGGLGIADRMVQAISRSGHTPGMASVPGKSHINNEMSPHKSLQ